MDTIMNAAKKHIDTTIVRRMSAKWTKDKVLAEARKRTRALMTDNTVRVQRMLDGLVKEAGWSEEEFIDALCADIIQNGPLAKN